MEFTKAQVEHALTERRVDPKCPACGSGYDTLLGQATVRIVTDDGATGWDLLPLFCIECGNVRLFDVRLLGLAELEPGHVEPH